MKIKNKELPRNVILLGMVSFLTDVSTEMILPVLPLFFVSIGVEKAIIGLIEGVAESTASLLKVFSGYYSDKIGKRKIFITSGYGLSTISKLLFAFVTTWQQALVVRFTERVGKGIRTSPRDAIIADSVKEETRGKWFGFHRAMDTTGAIIGSLIAFLIISYISYRKLFIISFIPALVAVILTLFVKEKYKVKEIGIFGSYVKNKQKKGSDLDILVEFEEVPSLIEFVEMENFLSDRLKIKVDLVMKKALKPHIGKEILKEVIYL